ncbi:wax ester/triacylglycerol synthase family O-acyltransferase [Hoyosella subflava]|uniref:Diacylglycerol O-acyltransferase n=1 Tax=Hoyosella subflava (strain DSM 45089 / JCM 17490 / NBRC 109087 / DQS3-9A1) TaxID=443218 RepID=F6ELE7_HOYSD|nr:wax ester/triacylglycerol synthase family O-acyltransferase [Hoyosella subflava]AEF39239.1 hypothetical protein AS9A_0787 [Hoyosella subflava DQS3-9A1]
MQQVNAHDAMFLHVEDTNWAAHGGMVVIYDPATAPNGTVRFKDILRHLDDRLSRSPVFRRCLVRVPFDLDHPYWIEDEHFDLEWHVRHVRLPEPADWRQLCIMVARLDSRALDLNRPPWEMYVIEGLDNIDGVAKGSYAIFTKLHHIAVDGHAMRDILSGIHDLTPEVRHGTDDDKWTPEKRPGMVGLMGRALLNNVIRAPVRTARAGAAMLPSAGLLSAAVLGRSESGSLIPSRIPHTRFQTQLTPHRVLDGRVFQFDDIKRLRKAVPGATVNDVVIAVIGGAVRRYLEAKNETPTEPLVCGAPVDLRKGQESVAGNDIAFLAVALGSEIADPVERLAHIQQSTTGAKEMQRAVGARQLSELSASFPGALTSWGFKTLAATQILFGSRRPMFNVGVSNVPGPQVPLYMNGARAQRFFGVAPILSGTALAFGVFSYCGVVDITFVSCRRALPDPELLAECLQASFDESMRCVP